MARARPGLFRDRRRGGRERRAPGGAARRQRGHPHARQRLGKAYTSASFKAPSGAIAERLLANPPAAQLGHLPDVLLLGGGLPIKIGDEVVGAIGAGGAPGGDKDEACAKAGLDKIADRLK